MTKFSYSDTEKKVLKNFQAINPNMVLFKDHLEVVNPRSQSCVGWYDFDKTKDHADFGLYDVGQLISVIETGSDHQLEVVNDDWVNVEVNGGSQKIFLTDFNDIGKLDDVVAGPDIHTNFEGVETSLEFSLSSDRVQTLQKLINIFKQEKIFLRVNDGKIDLMAVKEDLQSENPTTITIPEEQVLKADLDESKSLFVRVADLQLLEGEYKVRISSEGISHWENVLYGVSYYIGVDEL
jgi:hypothetical protein